MKIVRVMSSSDVTGTVGPQGQRLLPCVTKQECGAEGISAGLVHMPPGARSKAHYHANSEIIVICVRGWAATLIGPELKPYFHGPGEFIYIPEGVVHTAVNLSIADDLVAVEMRTDPEFNDDVVLTPEYELGVAAVVDQLHRSAVPESAGSTPAWWNGEVVDVG